MVKPLFCCPDYLVDDGGFVLSKRSGKPHIIFQVIRQSYGKKSYKGCIWEYAD